MTENELIRLAVFDSESQAILAKAILDENGILANLSGLEPSALGISLDGDDALQLFVRREDFEKAKELIEDVDEAEDDVAPAWKCECGADVDEGFFVCWSCGAEYKA